jgi:hypothetical protein
MSSTLLCEESYVGLSVPLIPLMQLGKLPHLNENWYVYVSLVITGGSLHCNVLSNMILTRLPYQTCKAGSMLRLLNVWFWNSLTKV